MLIRSPNRLYGDRVNQYKRTFLFLNGTFYFDANIQAVFANRKLLFNGLSFRQTVKCVQPYLFLKYTYIPFGLRFCGPFSITMFSFSQSLCTCSNCSAFLKSLNGDETINENQSNQNRIRMCGLQIYTGKQFLSILRF